MSQEEEEGGEKKKGGEELRGGGEKAGDTPKPISRGKKKSRLILDGLEPRSWRPEEVRVVWCKSWQSFRNAGKETLVKGFG